MTAVSVEPYRNALGECLRCFSDHLTGEDIADGVHHNRRLLVAIITFQLREVLKAEADSNLIASRRGIRLSSPLNIWSAARL